MVREAIQDDPKLSQMDIKVFAKGSYANRTNIPSDSDVDVGVIANKYFFNIYPPGKTARDFNFIDATYTYEEFKDDVARAIRNKFGNDGITIGTKAINVHSNSCRVDADVVPHFVHRIYQEDHSHKEGVALKTQGKQICNWPDQDYDYGVLKNERTNKRYKALVRILKNLKSEMLDEGDSSAERMASYLIACLAYNVPDDLFQEENYQILTRNALRYLYNQTALSINVQHWREVNSIKLLFGVEQPWRIADVHAFLGNAQNFLQRLANEG